MTSDVSDLSSDNSLHYSVIYHFYGHFFQGLVQKLCSSQSDIPLMEGILIISKEVFSLIVTVSVLIENRNSDCDINLMMSGDLNILPLDL